MSKIRSFWFVVGIVACALSLSGDAQRRIDPLADHAPHSAPRTSSDTPRGTSGEGGETTFGIDVSRHQRVIDWPAVREAGVRFAFIRVSYGMVVDAFFERNWREAADAGITRGAYQYFRPGHDGARQADLFMDTVGRRRAGDFPPVLDVERSDGRPDRAVVHQVRRWIERYRERSGLDRVIIYTGHFWREIDSPRMPGTDLWIAHYTNATNPRFPRRWSEWRFWQYSQTGRVPGITGPVDLDRFNGDETAMRTYAQTL